jgi:hypothetical protein
MGMTSQLSNSISSNWHCGGSKMEQQGNITSMVITLRVTITSMASIITYTMDINRDNTKISFQMFKQS